MKIKKKLIFCFFTLFQLFSTFKLFSTIIEINDICALKPFIAKTHIDKDTLILFDIDDTLLDSPISLNSGPWIHYFWQNVPKLLPKKMSVIEEVMWHVSKSVPCLPVEPCTATLIAECQKHFSLVPLAFTARPIYKKNIDGVKVTSEQLLSIHIDFSKTSSPLSLTRHPSFQNGIIFTSGKLKGDFLQQFLLSTGHRPGQIIFIDDKLDQIQSVERTMQAAGLKVICIWYRHASINRPTFNLQIANIQLEHLLKHQLIMNDDEAMAIMQTGKYNSITPEDFLKQLIEYYEKNILECNKAVKN